MMTEMFAREGVYLAKFDFCELGMEVSSGRGKKASAKKRTSVITNSKHFAETLRLAQRDGSHRHEQLVNGKAKQCEIYPEKFSQLICESIKREIADARWRRHIAGKFEFGPAVEWLMAVQAKLDVVELPHEKDGATRFHGLYKGQDVVDDVTGLQLNKELAMQARKVEIDFFKARCV